MFDFSILIGFDRVNSFSVPEALIFISGCARSNMYSEYGTLRLNLRLECNPDVSSSNSRTATERRLRAQLYA